MKYILNFIELRLEELKSNLYEFIHINERIKLFGNFLKIFSKKIELIITNNLSNFQIAWEVSYKVYPDWTIAITGLTILLGPYVLWAITNIFVLVILFFWYFSIFLYNYIIDKDYDVYLASYFEKLIIKFKYLISFIYFFEFNYSSLLNIILIICDFIKYTNNNPKYKYDMYGNPIILIRISFLNFFKNYIYINNYLDSFYYQFKLKLDWRTLLTYHISEEEGEDPEDCEQIILWPLLRFKYRLYFLKIIRSVNIYDLFNRVSKRRRFHFIYKVRKSIIIYFILNIKTYLILVVCISFLNCVFFNLILKMLRYLFSI